MSRPPLAAGIFDMDGLLIDSEPIHYESLRIQLDRYGIAYGEALHATLVGTTDEHVYAEIRRAHPTLDATTDALVAERHTLFLELVDRPLEPRPGVVETLSTFADADLPMAVASSSPSGQIEAVLTNLGIRDHFTAVRSGFSVARSKPFPDVYVATAADLTVRPDACLVFEDSSPGVEAARAAGAVVIAIPCPASEHHDLSRAHWRLTSMNEFDLDACRARFRDLSPDA
jgi:HAD superfamily hydrolase (TIGR01509 family)